MCGIAGVISADSRAVEPAVRAMMRAMVHRGPDDEGYEQFPVAAAGGSAGEATLGLGFRRLAILDLTSAGHQPMVHKATGDCLIFNGEIYNFRWLRAKLESQGANVRSSGDTEVLLHALVAWGEKALDQIDGMYAFAFYHAASRRVLLARDPFGIKPLYVAHAQRAFAFASEVRTVLASGLVASDLDPAGIASMLAYGAPQDPLTIHREIGSFPAGSCEWIGAEAAAGSGPMQRRRFWRFPNVGQTYDEQTAVRRIETQLNASVRDQCISDVPMGVFLSGGIDSATLAAIARNHLSPVNTFAIGFESAGGTDELADAAATARALGTHHVQTVLDDEWIRLQWGEWLQAADRPSIDGLNTFVVSGVVKQGGATVALSGIGADELFGGYPCFSKAQQLHRLLKPLAFVPPRLRRSAAAAALAALPAGKRAKAVDLVAGGGSCVELAASLRRVTSGRDLRALGLEPESLGLSEQYLPASALSAFTDPAGDPFNAVSQAECFLYMGNTLLRDADTNSMAHSLEIRVPFLDRWLVDLVGAMPGGLKAPQGAPPKHLLRKAAGAILPHDLFARPKRGFTLPIGEWMFGPLQGECEAAIDTVAACSALNGAAVRRLWDSYRSQSGATHWSRPLALVVLGNYLRR
jgi:asparagine synthase (glutamine-hydrolysing)